MPVEFQEIFTPLFYIVLFVVPLILSISFYFLLRNKFQKKIWLWLIIIGSFFVILIAWFFIFMGIASATDNLDLFVEQRVSTNQPYPIITSEPISLEDTLVEINVGGSTSIGAIILNYQAEAEDFEIITETLEEGIDCSVDDNEFNLESGKQKEIEIFIETIGASEGLYVCNIELLLNGEQLDETSILIEVTE